MPKHVRRANYPSSWDVLGKDNGAYSDFPDETLDLVTGAVFKKNGVYEGTLRRRIDMTHFKIEFQKKETLAEVELLGTRSALNALWPYGRYPCSQRFAVITSRREPKKLFTGSMGSISDSDFWARPQDGSEYYTVWRRSFFDGAKPFITRAELPKNPVVREVIVEAILLSKVRKVVLQGSFCQPSCRMDRSKGWKSLGANKPRKDVQDRIHVKKPGKYEAYRLKFYPRRRNGRRVKHFFLYDLVFLGCTA